MAALADRLEARKMHDGIDAVRREDLMQDGAVLRIRLIERGALARDGLDLVDDRTGRIGQVVQNDDVVARLKQLDAGVAGLPMKPAPPVTRIFITIPPDLQCRGSGGMPPARLHFV